MCKRKWLAMLLFVCLLAGCRTRYDLTLTNGSVISASSKPTLKGNYYVFKDVRGRETQITSFRVLQIERKSAGEKSREPFSAPSAKPPKPPKK